MSGGEKGGWFLIVIVFFLFFPSHQPSHTNTHLLVPLAQFGHVAKINVRDAAVGQRKNVARVRVTMKQAKLEQLAQPRHDAAPNEFVDVDAGRQDGGGVGAAHAVDPLHDQDAARGQVGAHPWDFHRRVAVKVAPKVGRVAGFLGVVQFFEQLFAKLIHDEFGVAAEAAHGKGGHERGRRAEQHEIGHDRVPRARALHFDGDVFPRFAQHGAVDLAQGRGGDGAVGDGGEKGAQRTPQLGFDDGKRFGIGKGGHVVLQGAQLVHVVFAHNVGARCQDLARFDE